MTSTYLAAFEARTDLSQYKDNALLLFTLQLRFDIEDIHSVATTSLTDGFDDKKCDLLYIDKDAGIAVIAQGYFCSKTSFPSEAPANKASDLNTSVAWLLATPIEQLPGDLKSVASELREALTNNEIKSIEFWYSHNLPESQNVQNELDAVARNAQNAIKQEFPSCSAIRISGQEFGVTNTGDLYQSLTTPILVDDELTIETEAGFEMKTDDWSAYSTAISAKWLYEQFETHSSKLFSANIRGYLGSRNTDANINNGIKETAQQEPQNFYVFNNGITAITHSFTYDDEENCLKIKGISIVNGAQTTGAIGSLASTPSSELKIQTRFIVCSSQKTIQSIIRYNNSQNQVEATDFRSNDLIQKRLIAEFSDMADVEYSGGRRGGSEDIIKRPGNLLASSTVGQSLTAFHGDPSNAYNHKSEIWNSNHLYSKVFNSKTTAKHIVFVYSLYESLNIFKQSLITKAKANEITTTEEEQLKFFQHRGSSMLFTTAIASCLEIILDCKITDLFKLSFGNLSIAQAKKYWQQTLNPLTALATNLSPAVQKGIAGQETITSSITTFRSLVNATKIPNESIYENFKSKIIFD